MERKKAFVTGGSRGIGRGIVEDLAKNGYDVAFTYNTKEDEAKDVYEIVKSYGVRCFYYQASLEKAEVPEEVTKKAINDLGGINLLVCNAGLTKHNSLLTTDIELIDFVYGLNYRSYVLCSKVATNYMVDNNIEGNVIFISSTRGIRAYDHDSLYGSLKAALHRLVESFALEMAKYGIRVNCVAPGAIAVRGSYDMDSLKNSSFNKIVPLKRRGKPDDIASLVTFIASDKASYLTGETIKVDGGLILYGPSEEGL